MDQNADDLAATRPVKAMATPSTTAKHLSDAFDGADDDSVVNALGAAVVMCWQDVPQDTQRNLFENAVKVLREDQGAQLREKLARFLHDHKDEVDSKEDTSSATPAPGDLS